MSQLVRLARWTQPNYTKLAASRGRAQLLTLPYSHFCELGSWSLQCAGIPFDEHAFGPGQHILPLLSLRVAGEQRHLATTSATTAVDTPRRPRTRPYKPHHATSVPAACLPDGRVLVDSWAIVREAAVQLSQPPLADDLQALLDENYAPRVRQTLYTIIFRECNREAWDGLVTQEGGAFALAWRLGLGQSMTERMVRLFRADDGAAAAHGRERMHAARARVEQYVEQRLGEAGGGDGFLGGAAPGMADVAIAALSGPMVLPPLYCGGRYQRWFDLLLERDADARDEIEAYRQTAAGKHCLSVYEACRGVAP